MIKIEIVKYSPIPFTAFQQGSPLSTQLLKSKGFTFMFSVQQTYKPILKISARPTQFTHE